MSRPTPVQLWVCHRGICPPMFHSGRCHHGRLEQTTYIPIRNAEEMLESVLERIVAACDVCRKLPDGFDRHAAHGREARAAVDAITDSEVAS